MATGRATVLAIADWPFLSWDGMETNDIAAHCKCHIRATCSPNANKVDVMVSRLASEYSICGLTGWVQQSDEAASLTSKVCFMRIMSRSPGAYCKRASNRAHIASSAVLADLLASGQSRCAQWYVRRTAAVWSRYRTDPATPVAPPRDRLGPAAKGGSVRNMVQQARATRVYPSLLGHSLAGLAGRTMRLPHDTKR